MDVSSETLLKDKTDSKHLYLRRLTAQLREKDIELAKLLEQKMKFMKEMVEVVNKNPKHIDDLGGLSLEHSDISHLNNSGAQLGHGKDSGNQSQTCQPQGIILPNPEYLGLVREQKDRNYYTKEQLLSAVQVSYFYLKSISLDDS